MDAYAKSKTPKEARDKRATPSGVFARFEKVLGLRFNFDICAEDHTAKTGYYWTEQINALSRGWAAEIGVLLGTTPIIWMNPPYSDPYPWCKKAADEAEQGALIVGLLPDDRSTAWYQDQIWARADRVFVPDKRIAFHGPDGKPQKGNPKGSIFVLWTPWQTGNPPETRFKLEV